MVLQYTHQFPDAVKETVKRVTNGGFSYFTSWGSYCEVPEDMVAFDKMPKIRRPPDSSLAGRSRLLKEMGQQIWKGTRQLSVRATCKSTKNNLGTLPTFAYGCCSLANNLLMPLEDMRSNISSEEDRPDVGGEGGEGKMKTVPLRRTLMEVNLLILAKRYLP